MEISLVKPSENPKFQIYIIKDFNEAIGLFENDKEKTYAEEVLEKRDQLVLNRYDVWLCIYKQKAEMKTYALNESLRKAGNSLAKQLNSEKAKRVLIQSLNQEYSAVEMAEGMALGNYQFLKYFSDRAKKQNSLKSIHLADVSEAEIQNLKAKLKGTFLARDLVNEPLSYLTATKLSEEASNACEALGIKVEIFNKKKIESLKMGGLLAVNRGSQDPPTFTIMEYKPENAKNEKPIVFVGKGVVYDTGGLSLKPTPGSMDSMKSDMGGSAAAIGAIVAAASAKLPVHVVSLVPATDNRPGEKAYTPGDVIKMYDGSTVEVLNTDAEGRMILADALHYAKKYKPQIVFDLATLTGAAAIAIGKYGVVGMGTAEEADFTLLDKAGKTVYERIARFPFWDEYAELMKSSIADQKNIGGREAGAITAGKFLEKFTDYPWIHLDIAGPAFLSADDHYRKKGGTGVGVRLLFEYLRSL